MTIAARVAASSAGGGGSGGSAVELPDVEPDVEEESPTEELPAVDIARNSRRGHQCRT